MATSNRKSLRTSAPLAAALLLAGMVAAPAQADLLGWFRQPRVSYGQPAYVAPAQVAPVIAAPAAAAPTVVAPTCAGTTNYYRPWTSYRPWTIPGFYRGRDYRAAAQTSYYAAAVPQVAGYAAADFCEGCTTPQPVVTGYAPQQTFRTTWTQIPVTYYRPVTSYAPATSTVPVTALQPCTTYQWQARRVPVNSGWGWLGGLFGHRNRAYYAPVTAAANCVNCAPTAAYAAPYYSSPVTTTAPAVSGSTIISPGAAPPSGAAVPADQAPSLDPGAFPGSAAPPTSGYGATLRKIETPLSQTGASRDAEAEPAPKGKFTIPPVRDPDEPQVEQKTQAPPLLEPGNRRDRVAQASGNYDWAFTPVAWPQGEPAKLAIERPASTPPRQQRWDDSGWRSVRP